MNFQDLHEQLRLELLRRIDRGLLSGTSLARQAGFQQGHISNFLNRRRSLSLEGLDRVLAAQSLTVEDLTPLDLSAAAASMQADGPGTSETDSIPIVAASTAMDEAVPRPGSILETLPVSFARLAAARTDRAPRRAAWQRFVAIRADGAQAAALDPILQPGAVVVLDRITAGHERPAHVIDFVNEIGAQLEGAAVVVDAVDVVVVRLGMAQSGEDMNVVAPALQGGCQLGHVSADAADGNRVE